MFVCLWACVEAGEVKVMVVGAYVRDGRICVRVSLVVGVAGSKGHSVRSGYVDSGLESYNKCKTLPSKFMRKYNCAFSMPTTSLCLLHSASLQKYSQAEPHKTLERL